MKLKQGLFLLSTLAFLYACQPDESAHELTRKEQSIKDAFDLEFERTKDPALGYPPTDRLLVAYAQIEKMRQSYANRTTQGVENTRFVQRGPNNIGGRTRTIHIDLRDPERKTIWAGSVSGGLWRTDDITAPNPVWIPANDYLSNLSIASMAQDPFNPDIMYIGTGETASVRGIGMFKSTDGGINWEYLPSTNSSLYRYVRAMFVHPVTGDLYVATTDGGSSNGGVMRSRDGGSSWSKVLGNGASVSGNMYDLAYVKGKIYASNVTNIYSSESGDVNTWTDLTNATSAFPDNLSRVEFSVCEQEPNIIYAVGSMGGAASNIYRTNNGGQQWISLGRPTGGDFTNGQAWYDLEIAVDPYSCDHVIVGGVAIYRTTNGGANWGRFAQTMHVDQHKTVFDAETQGLIYFGNDGGVYRSTGGTGVEPENKNLGYITTQYYGCAIHPDTFSNYFLGGTQDNGSHQLNQLTVANGRNVWGGDGFLCHIDEDNPNIQLVSSQFGNWGLSTDGGANFSGGQSVNGGFLTPSDYDSRTNILYTQTGDADFYRWNVIANTLERVDLIGFNQNISYMKVDPTVENRLYIGTNSGIVVRVDDANEGDTIPAPVVLSIPGFGRSISGIDILPSDPQRMIVTLSNYGIPSVYVTSDGGENWEICEGNLPDMPVRSVVFNPRNRDQAMIATEAGVWTTALLDGANTIWIPPVEGLGSPIVRTDDLQIRYSDNVVLAGTYGRGLWTTSVFSEPRVKFFVPLVHYVNAPVQFVGDVSLNADTYNWLFGDGDFSTEANPFHMYDAIGEYDFELTINGELSSGDRIKILPDGELPYVKDETNFGGDFEGFTEQYGVHTVSGSGFERGNSSILGKNGVRSGENAFVIGLNEEYYQPWSESYLYIPVFDFSEPGIYTFSFWARYFLQWGLDGFLVEYSTDRGVTWQVLGSDSDKNWYNSDGSTTPVFPEGTPYFTKEVGGYTNYTHDLTFLSGTKDVAFRFVFKSEGSGNHIGLAIDDVEVISYAGELKTNVRTFNAEFGIDKEIIIKWSTEPEYYCKRFEIERSDNGRDFQMIDVVQSTEGLTADRTQYEKITSGGRDFYFYRMKVINEYTPDQYYFEFYTDTVTVRRNSSEPPTVFSIFPNPFIDHVSITFNDAVNQEVSFKVFDASGRLLQDDIQYIDSPFHTFSVSQWPAGIYYLSVQIGEEEPDVYPLYTNGG